MVSEHEVKKGDILIIAGNRYKITLNPTKLDPITQKPFPMLTRVQ